MSEEEELEDAGLWREVGDRGDILLPPVPDRPALPLKHKFIDREGGGGTWVLPPNSDSDRLGDAPDTLGYLQEGWKG